MGEALITKEIREYLKSREFINVGTCDFNGRPNVVPKFIVKVDKEFLYLADHVFGRTWENLKLNPRVSLATVNIDTLVGYQINGKAEIIASGDEYNRILADLSKRQIDLSVERVIESVQSEKKGESFELAFPERVVIFKIKAEEVVKIFPTGKLERNYKALDDNNPNK